MIELSFKIEDRQTLQKASFLADIFGHWYEIREDRHFPDKRNFRPQKFAKFLPQIAMVTRTAEGHMKIA
ncbi:PAS domain-containing protein [Kordiimonas gwangyangensis]|uniref:PAS domain-containing protein n=1 Tax=Kordiimonas gwangyangensis TaxID=288022 RepID=UPI00047010C0|nr:PAS domain-containing protein [Kordiimonas gwangyangensis]